MRFFLRTVPPPRGCPTNAKSHLSTASHAHAATSPANPTPTPPGTANPHSTMPPNFHATTARLPTFTLPAQTTPSPANLALGRALVAAFRRDGIIQLAMTPAHRALWRTTLAASTAFFGRPHADKAACVDARSYAGYIASGEEVTGGVADYSEVFTVTRDLGVRDARVRAGWPCHGPVPWPSGGGMGGMREAVGGYMAGLGVEGEKVVQLVEMGLGLGRGALMRYTRDGWHHMRVLRFPAGTATNGKGKEGRGIGSHTDYGLLVISAQDDVGGLFIRRPNHDERFANWEKSAAGLREDEDGWVYVPPVEGVHTVILGDMMQYLTRNYLTATPHKVGLNTRERFAIAYFHEPSFQAVLKPLEDGCGSMPKQPAEGVKGIHYGTHFTNMFMRSYADRITTRRLVAEGRYSLLKTPELRTMGAAPA